MSDDPSGNAVSTAIDQYCRLLFLASHEFRTPASVVGGYLKMLQSDTGALDVRQRKMIDEAAKSCARLAALIDEMSDVARLDSDSAVFTVEPFDLFSELEGVLRGVHEAEDRGVRLELRGMSSGAPLTADRRRLSAAFGALVRSILREQPTAATIVADRRLATADGVVSAVVVVAREADVAHARDAPETQLDEYRGGTGFSLPIARRVIERTGGRVWSVKTESDGAQAARAAVVISIPLSE